MEVWSRVARPRAAPARRSAVGLPSPTPTSSTVVRAWLVRVGTPATGIRVTWPAVPSAPSAASATNRSSSISSTNSAAPGAQGRSDRRVVGVRCGTVPVDPEQHRERDQGNAPHASGRDVAQRELGRGDLRC